MLRVGWLALLAAAMGCTDPMPEGRVPEGWSITPTDCGPDSCVTAASTDVDGCGQIVGEAFECEGFCHVRDDYEPTWESNPPHSGDHSSVVLRSLGEHDQPEPPSRWLENLERGQVVLLYECPEDCPTERAALHAVMDARSDAVLMTPGLDLAPSRFAAVSWTWVYRFDQPNERELLCFIDQHTDHGRVAMP